VGLESDRQIASAQHHFAIAIVLGAGKKIGLYVAVNG
jgi:hypothetical protein